MHEDGASFLDETTTVGDELAIDYFLTLENNQETLQFMLDCLLSIREWASVEGRIDVLDDAFENNTRKNDLVYSIELDGSPRGVAARTVIRLLQFGRTSDGHVARIFLHHVYKLMKDDNPNKNELATFLGIKN